MNEKDLLIAQMLSGGLGAYANSGTTPKVGASALSGALSGGATGFAVGGPVGGAIGAAGGGILSAVSASKQKREYEMSERKAKEARDAIRLDNYPTTGVNSTFKYYRNGGIMRKYANGGIEPIGMTGGRAVGPQHEGGGVYAGQDPNTGEVQEVEGGEVKHSTDSHDVWFSNDLKTDKGESFADAASKLLERKAKIEEGLSSKSKVVRQTAQRNLEKLNMELDELTAMQMAQQQEKGIPIDGETSGVGVRKAQSGATFSRIAPYLDNAVNLAVTAATPAVPSPVYQQQIDLDTDYNVTDQIEGERQGLNQIRKDIDRNVSNSAVGRTNKIAAASSSIGRQNQIYGNKERMETQLENQERSINYQTDARNTAAQNSFRQQQAARADQIGSNISANAANAVDDFITQETEDRLRNRDLATLELLKKKYQDLGIWDRNIEGAFQKFMTGEISYEEFIALQNQSGMGKTLATSISGNPNVKAAAGFAGINPTPLSSVKRMNSTVSPTTRPTVPGVGRLPSSSSIMQRLRNWGQ